MTMAERLIDAEALKHKRVIAIYGNLEQGLEEREVVYVEDIDNAPTIEAKPVVHAHWIKDNDSGYYNCCDCGFPATFEMTQYACWCPICGAQMDELVSNTNKLNNSKDVICGATNLPCCECMPCCSSRMDEVAE